MDVCPVGPLLQGGINPRVSLHEPPQESLVTQTLEESACDAEDLGSVLGSGKSPGEGSSNPLQYSCLENPMDRGAWRATVCGISKGGDTIELPHTPRDEVFFVSCTTYTQGRGAAKLFPSLCDPMVQRPSGFSVHGQEYWNGLPFPPPEALPNPGIEPMSLLSPELAGGIFITSATWGNPAG